MHKIIFFFLVLNGLWGRAQDLVILHTNDIHSHLMGFSPETEYTPMVNKNDSTLGGFARVAGYIKSEKEKFDEKLLTLDAGDFLMGTLFQTIELKKGFQLNLMHETGYDFIAIGNHEFDYGPNSLAQIINNSQENGQIPQLLCSNYDFDKTTDAKKLKELFANGTILPFDIVEKNNYRIGILAIMGNKAANYIPEIYNVEFEKMNKAARKTAKHLKKNKNVDIVIALSHSGIYRDDQGRWQGEDIKLAEKNKHIDIIISGHSHTKVKQPIQAGNTVVVQAASSGLYVGRIEVVFGSFGKPLIQYKLVEMNDTIKADRQIQKKIEAQIPYIEQSVLSTIGVNFYTPVLETSFDLTLNESKAASSNLGPFVADAMHHWMNTKNRPGTDIVAVAAGVIRNNIEAGEHGKQNINDIFNVMPLGLGYDSIPGTPLAKIHITGKELKQIMELILAVSDVRT
ncbi:MAG TPA: bifunctional UDP-sugar hydrolase/5'-nucleotidase, partial [Prolixibacteraceae bacterium]|nr:bifunctional UDP-sugar hydrolase/5'-nucleotidase [Prolixibacteraceae bacterium]